VREASHGCDRLGCEIELGGTVVLVTGLAHLEDLLVEFGSVVETVLSSSSDREGDSARMPCSDTSDLSETLVCLSWESSSSPSRSNSGESLSLRGGEAIDLLVLTKDSIDRDVLFEQLGGKIELLLHGSSVNLDFHKMSLLLSGTSLLDLSVSKDSDDGSLGLQLLHLLSLDVLVLRVELGVFGERFLLGGVPSLVESSSEGVAQVIGPVSADVLESLSSGLITNDTDNDHGGSLDDGNGLDDFLLVDL